MPYSDLRVIKLSIIIIRVVTIGNKQDMCTSFIK